MKNIWSKIFHNKFSAPKENTCKEKTTGVVFVVDSEIERHKKIEKGAKDFAVRFESVMKELANG
jgi:hypothetical protein